MSSKHSSERTCGAIRNSGLVFPGERITVNLAPADIRKAGPAYDLTIAVGVLIVREQTWPQAVEDTPFVGERSLDGSMRHVRLPKRPGARVHRQPVRRAPQPEVHLGTGS